MATVMRLINTVTRDLIDWGYNITPIYPGMNLMDDFAAAFARLGITRNQGSTTGQSPYVYNWNTGFYECACNGGEYNIPVTFNQVFTNFIEPNSTDITSMVKESGGSVTSQGVDVPFIYTDSFSSNGIGISVTNFSWASIIRNVDANKNSQGAGTAGGGVPDWVVNAISYTIPVAYSFELTGAAEAGGASSASPWGVILITRGPDALSYKNFTSAGLGAGWISASAMAVGYKYYYVGDINNLKMDVFESWGNNISVSADVGFAVGLNISWVENPNVNGEYLIGVGVGAGVGVGPTIVSGQYTRQFNHIYW